MSTRTPTLSDRWLRRVQQTRTSADGRVWLCDLDCGHTVNHNRRRNRERPKALRCATCAGAKAGAS